MIFYLTGRSSFCWRAIEVFDYNKPQTCFSCPFQSTQQCSTTGPAVGIMLLPFLLNWYFKKINVYSICSFTFRNTILSCQSIFTYLQIRIRLLMQLQNAESIQNETELELLGNFNPCGIKQTVQTFQLLFI